MQTRLARVAANYLSSQLHTEVIVNKLDFRPFKGFTLDGFLIFDQRKDTLISADFLDVDIDQFDLPNRILRFDKVTLTKAQLNLFKLDSSGTTNLDFLIDYFSSEKKNEQRDIYTFDAKSLNIRNSKFSYESLFSENKQSGIDFSSIVVSQIDAQFSNLKLGPDSTSLSIDHLSFYEKSGFGLIGLRSDFKIDSAGVHATDLSMETNASFIEGKVSLLSENFDQYSDFLNQVYWNAEFFNSRINFGDIGYFVEDLYQINSEILFDGRVRGPISNLSGRQVSIKGGDRTLLKGNIDFNGLPDFENTFIDLRISEFSTDLEDILSISESIPSQGRLTESIPQEFRRAGDLFYAGSFTGFPEDFVTYGVLNTDAGSFSLDLNFERDSINDGVNYLGSFEAIDVNAGRLLDIDTLGVLSGSFSVDAFSRETFESAQVKGKLSELNYLGYRYENIDLDGNFARKRFSGSLESDDPNLNLIFNGVIDFSSSTPFYDFDAEIANIDLTALHLVQLEKDLSFSTRISLDGRGKDLNNAAGKMVAEQTLLCYGDSTIAVEKLNCSIYGDSLNRKLSFDSDIVDISITGLFDPAGLQYAFTNMLAEIMPSLASPANYGYREVFEFSVNYQSHNSISSFLVPGLLISKGTSLYGSFNSDARKLEVSFLTPGIEYREFSAKGLSADMVKTGEIFKGRIYANSFWIDSLNFDQPDVDIEAYNNYIELKSGWFGTTGNTSAQLELHTDFIDKNHFIVELEPGYFNVHDLKWEIDEKATFEKDSTTMNFSGFRVHSDAQTLRLDGSIGKTSEDTLFFEIRDFDLASLNQMGLGPKKKISGSVNLGGSLTDFYGSKFTEASGGIEDFILGEQKVGDLNISSIYEDQSKNLLLDAVLVSGDLELLSFKGVYNSKRDDQLTGELILDQFDLDIINEIDIPQVSDFSGIANGRIDVKGLITKPQLSGFIDFNQANFKIDYLNTDFTFNDRVRVEPDFFGIDYKPLYDSRGTKGYIVASAFHEDYGNWTYDISADVQNFFGLNTTRNDNSLYYGKAYASGTVQLGGYDSKLEVSIDASTEDGTEISLPLDENDEVALENFVHFINQEENTDENREIDLSGISIKLNLDATPGALVRIIFDEKAGDILQGSGVGKITLETTEGGDFNMFGRYEIYSGDYNFTLKNLISKRFTLLPGGTISWYGDPYNADLDLSALYGVRAPLYPIMIENRELYRSRELVNVVMALGGKLVAPTIGFQIELPQATENERTQLASAVSTVNQLNQQVFSLLILNKFFAIAAPDQAGTGVVNGLGAVANTSTSEFISNQLSGWLSEISNEFDIGFNYRPGDEITNEEIAVALSTQLFNERLLVSGSFGVTNTNEAQVTEGQSGILGDFLLEYMLTKDGKIRLKVFNETNPYEVFSTSTSMYTQGVGLIYQEDFNTIGEFFDKVGELFKDDVVEEEP
ncbi:MAG: translocation/assembly module TamB [Flavobacteriales bacterium]|nr:translocation/assembly module TamB [Flavobacteriales bacterium]